MESLIGQKPRDPMPNPGTRRRLADALRLRRVSYVYAGDIALELSLSKEGREYLFQDLMDGKIRDGRLGYKLDLPADMDILLTRYYRPRVCSLPPGSLIRIWIDTSLTIEQDLTLAEADACFQASARVKGPYFSPILETV